MGEEIVRKPVCLLRLRWFFRETLDHQFWTKVSDKCINATLGDMLDHPELSKQTTLPSFTRDISTYHSIYENSR